MKISFLKYSNTVLLIALNATLLVAAINDPFSIASFKSTDRQFPFRSNDIIKSESGRECSEIDSFVMVQPGRLLLRKKYEPGDYRIYKGTVDTAAFNREPPLYAFSLPRDIPVTYFVKKRLYSDSTTNQSSDIGEVYFDMCSFYVRHYSSVSYFHNGEWHTVKGVRNYPTGKIEVASVPSGAQVVINGISTLRKTPCTINDLPCGRYSIELFLPHYHFSHKEIEISKDTTVHSSFELMSGFDTAYISGTDPYGLLYFPQPPVDSAFVIDTLRTNDLQVRLLAGTYQIKWNGGTMYESIDTVLTIPEGRVIWFDRPFKRRNGLLNVSTLPFDAEICIETVPCSFGDRAVNLPSGIYQIEVSRNGFQNVKRIVTVLPDTLNEVVIDLRMHSDRDADGYLDSVDKCPDVYGIYDGCSKPQVLRAFEVKKNEVLEYVRNDRFDIGMSLIGYITRIPSNRHFSGFLSSFSNGRVGGVNNYRGLTMLNSLHVMWRGLYGSAELGQWASGIRYKRSDTLHLYSENQHYAVYYDSINGIEPVVYLPSTAVSLGFHYNWSWVNVIYSLGYQWEDIVLEQFYNVEKQQLERIVINNDWWYHQIHLEADFHADNRFVPSVYFNMKFPFGKVLGSHWYVLQVGLQLKVYPASKKGGTKNE